MTIAVPVSWHIGRIPPAAMLAFSRRSRATNRAPLPDCILLDVEMPVLSGPGMAHRMLVRDVGSEDIPILLVSARDDLSEIAERIGTPYFLAKTTPNHGKALLEILGRALRERRAPAHSAPTPLEQEPPSSP